MNAEALVRDDQEEAVKGLIGYYVERNMPVQSRFLKEDIREPGPEPGTQTRIALLQGLEEGQALRTVETLTAPVEGEEQRLIDARVMSADKVVVTVAEGVESPHLATALEPVGARLLERLSESSYRVQLPENDALAVPRWQESLNQLPEIASTKPDYLDLAYRRDSAQAPQPSPR